MRTLFWKIAAITAVAGALAACGSDNAPAPAPPTTAPPTTAARIEDGFGANFGTAYRADVNSSPRDPVAGDIVPLDLTKDPTTI